MKVLLCCILKMENNYLEEWVRHYINLGVDKIVIYDNNDIDGPYAENIEDIKYVKEQINNKIIDVYKIPNETCVQLKYYNECYKKYSDYDWLLFLDIDEYLMLENYTNIKDFLLLDKFKKYKMIHLNWKTFTDNEKIRVENNNYSLVSRFTTPCKDIQQLNPKVDAEIKSIVRGGIPNLEFTKNPHTLDSIKIFCCDAEGNTTNNEEQKTKNIIHTEAWINHYICKTIEEYCKTKLVRLGGHTPHKHNYRYTRNFFFTYNITTREKLKIFNNLVNKIRPRQITLPIRVSTPVKRVSYLKTYPKKQIIIGDPLNKDNIVKKITVVKTSVPFINSHKLKQTK